VQLKREKKCRKQKKTAGKGKPMSKTLFHGSHRGKLFLDALPEPAVLSSVRFSGLHQPSSTVFVPRFLCLLDGYAAGL
jgi:hypothetical protein